MPSTQRSRSRGGRYRVYRHKRRNYPLEERMVAEIGWNTWLRESDTLMSINNNVLVKVRVWQGFSGRNVYIFPDAEMLADETPGGSNPYSPSDS